MTKNVEPTKDSEVRNYIVLRTQHGEGCDYTIGCGQTWSFLSLNPQKESLEDRIYDDLVNDKDGEVCYAYHSLTGSRAQDYEIYEIKNTDFSWANVMSKLKKAADLENETAAKNEDEAEFDRLKKKLGK